MHHAFTGRFFQVGYVCRDLDQAIERIAGTAASSFLIIDVAGSLGEADAPVRRMALANLGPLNIELIEVAEGCGPFFSDALEKDGTLGFHHHGYLVTDMTAWAPLQQSLGGGQAPVMVGEVPGTLRYAYFDRRAELGHNIELIFLEEGGKTLFGSIPHTRLAPTSPGELT